MGKENFEKNSEVTTILEMNKEILKMNKEILKRIFAPILTIQDPLSMKIFKD